MVKNEGFKEPAEYFLVSTNLFLTLDYREAFVNIELTIEHFALMQRKQKYRL